MKRFEGHHLLGDPFDKGMILFKNIIEIFDWTDFNDGARSGEFLDRVDGLKPSRFAPLLSMITFCGTLLVAIDFLKNWCAAVRSLRSDYST